MDGWTEGEGWRDGGAYTCYHIAIRLVEEEAGLMRGAWCARVCLLQRSEQGVEVAKGMKR